MYKNGIAEQNGKFYGKITIKGQQRQFLCHGAKSRTQAQAIVDAERFKLREELAGIRKAECKITIHQMLDRLLKYSEVNKKSYTTDVCRVKILKNLIPNTVLISKTKPEYIEKLKTKLLERKLSVTTVNKYLALLSKGFSLEVQNKNLEYNPCSMVKYFNKVHNKIRYLHEDEETRLFKVLPEYMKDIVHTALYTGLRKDNIRNLQWYQVDFKLHNIEILENKGNKHIIIPMVEPLEEILKRRYQESNSEYVFANPETGKPYYEIDRCWRDCLEQAKIENFRFHDLRHTVGTRLAAKGVPVNVIKEILAHSDIRTTMKYVHLVEGSKKQALDSIIMK